MSSPRVGHGQLCELGAPMPVDFLPANTQKPFPHRFCHLTEVLLPNTEQLPVPSDFQISDFLTSEIILIPFGFPQGYICHAPYIGKKDTESSSLVWKTARGHMVSLAPGLDTSQPGQVIVLGSGIGGSCDQPNAGTLLKLLGKGCSP